MSEGLINYLMMLRGVEVGILYRQISKNKYKVSFRSAGKVNVAKLSEALGGGGHKQAAGATMEGNLKDIQARVRILVDDVIKKL
jgi:phosphoesterase RecJ-like protein